MNLLLQIKEKYDLIQQSDNDTNKQIALALSRLLTDSIQDDNISDMENHLLALQIDNILDFLNDIC